VNKRSNTVDGDEINQIAINIPELTEFFQGFNPMNMLVNRTDETIKMDISPNENLSLAIFSDR